MNARLLFFVVALGAVLAAGSAPAQSLDLILPTPNQALLSGDGPAFYQYTNRTFRGRRSKPWQGGQYGFVRNQKDTPAGVAFTRFHEGVDIRPLHRTASGRPLDPVWSVADGRVAHVNNNPNGSSYGLYVVVEHWWDGSPFYSLYAHLADVRVRAGDVLQQGDRLGTVGYTGRGIDRERAHLHFEINLLLNSRFQAWYDARNLRSRNRHGVYNGMNLAGLDVAALYLALQETPDLSIADFLTSEEPFYRVRFPNEGMPELWARYPWLGTGYDPAAPSIEIEFTRSGLPVGIRSSQAPVVAPVVADARPTPFPYGDVTRHLSGAGGRPRLSKSGGSYLDLLRLGARVPAAGEGVGVPAPGGTP